MRECIFYYSSYEACQGNQSSHTWKEVHLQESGVELQGCASVYTFCSEHERRQTHMYVL